MTNPNPAAPRKRDELTRLARLDHERNCPDDADYEKLSVQHRHVHETAARRIVNRMERR